MGRPWNSNNVVTGRFGKRSGGRTRWLSSQEYQALSATERKALWREREHARAIGRHRRQVARFTPRRPRWQRKLIELPIVFGMVIAATWAVDRFDGIGTAPPAAVASAPGERVTFGLCVWGGGTNCVVDGDTIYLHGQKIRIAGIDAPETHNNYKCAAEKALGDRATARLRELLNGGAITLSSIDRDEDVYGRKLRNVAVDGQDVGETLISEGLSRAYRGHKMGWC